MRLATDTIGGHVTNRLSRTYYDKSKTFPTIWGTTECDTIWLTCYTYVRQAPKYKTSYSKKVNIEKEIFLKSQWSIYRKIAMIGLVYDATIELALFMTSQCRTE